jgi:crossover junction endodeoxyribonuclease RuvC
VEKVSAMPGQGVVSMFNFGHNLGLIEGLLRGYGISYQLVPPQTWKKEFSLSSDKAKSIEVCQKLFPNVSLLATERSRKPNDGIAEALLMAEYARRKL